MVADEVGREIKWSRGISVGHDLVITANPALTTITGSLDHLIT
jgi:hypothetical protein